MDKQEVYDREEHCGFGQPIWEIEPLENVTKNINRKEERKEIK